MSHPIFVRLATISDVSAIQALADATLPQELSHTRDEAQIERYMQRIFSEKAVQHMITHEGNTLLLAFVDEQIAGLCHFGSPLIDDCEDRKDIYRLLIHPDYRQRGVALALIDEVEQHFRDDAEVMRLVTYVHAADSARIRFFGKCGFHHDHLEDTEAGEWYMEKDL